MTAADKAIHHACAVTALQGILAVPSHDDWGRRTIVLTSGTWTREVLPEELVAALEVCRAHRAPGTFA